MESQLRPVSKFYFSRMGSSLSAMCSCNWICKVNGIVDSKVSILMQKQTYAPAMRPRLYGLGCWCTSCYGNSGGISLLGSLNTLSYTVYVCIVYVNVTKCTSSCKLHFYRTVISACSSNMVIK
jgi:hypothetical protein